MTRAGHRNRYKSGDYLADCARCGFTYYASELQKEWTGHRVCKTCFEPRHPQDLIKVRKERGIPWAQPPQNLYVSGIAYHTADGTLMADGSWIADGGAGSPSEGTEIYVVFGPVDPDSL
jgi:hypothetical protein